MTQKLRNYFKYVNEIGTDEAGRGCLAGPVTAAAVILGPKFKDSSLNDSKLLKADQREKFRPVIERECIAFGVAHIHETKIDEINILNASFLAMHKAIDQIPLKRYIVVDGNRFRPYHNVPHSCIIKGDAKFMNIAAASILAKTYRDAYMETIHKEFPMYGWNQNKGYPTKAHRAAIKKYGPCKYHRSSFKLLPAPYDLEL